MIQFLVPFSFFLVWFVFTLLAIHCLAPVLAKRNKTLMEIKTISLYLFLFLFFLGLLLYFLLFQ